MYQFIRHEILVLTCPATEEFSNSQLWPKYGLLLENKEQYHEPISKLSYIMSFAYVYS